MRTHFKYELCNTAGSDIEYYNNVCNCAAITGGEYKCIHEPILHWQHGKLYGQPDKRWVNTGLPVEGERFTHRK